MRLFIDRYGYGINDKIPHQVRHIPLLAAHQHELQKHDERISMLQNTTDKRAGKLEVSHQERTVTINDTLKLEKTSLFLHRGRGGRDQVQRFGAFRV
ncbi:MAG: hypothetical protein ABEJ56_00200 [Candidatus Nanohaloarchaea archaeon]